MAAICLALLSAALTPRYVVPPPLLTRAHAHLPTRIIRMLDVPEAVDGDGDGEADSLLASFASALEEEGGASKVARASEAARAKDAVREETQKAGQILNRAVDWDGKAAKASFPGGTEGILDVGSWRLTLGFFGITILFAAFSALTTDFGSEDAAELDARYEAQMQASRPPEWGPR